MSDESWSPELEDVVTVIAGTARASKYDDPIDAFLKSKEQKWSAWMYVDNPYIATKGIKRRLRTKVLHEQIKVYTEYGAPVLEKIQ